MQMRSHAFKRLVWLYRQLLRRMRALERVAGRTVVRRIFMRVHVEALPPRVMMSVTPALMPTPLDLISANPATIVPANNTVAHTPSATGATTQKKHSDHRRAGHHSQFRRRQHVHLFQDHRHHRRDALSTRRRHRDRQRHVYHRHAGPGRPALHARRQLHRHGKFQHSGLHVGQRRGARRKCHRNVDRRV